MFEKAKTDDICSTKEYFHIDITWKLASVIAIMQWANVKHGIKECWND